MQVTIIRYHRLINLGNYENEKYEVEIALQEGDDPHAVAAQAKTLVEQFLGCAPDTSEETFEPTSPDDFLHSPSEDEEDDDSPF